MAFVVVAFPCCLGWLCFVVVCSFMLSVFLFSLATLCLFIAVFAGSCCFCSFGVIVVVVFVLLCLMCSFL